MAVYISEETKNDVLGKYIQSIQFYNPHLLFQHTTSIDNSYNKINLGCAVCGALGVIPVAYIENDYKNIIDNINEFVSKHRHSALGQPGKMALKSTRESIIKDVANKLNILESQVIMDVSTMPTVLSATVGSDEYKLEVCKVALKTAKFHNFPPWETATLEQEYNYYKQKVMYNGYYDFPAYKTPALEAKQALEAENKTATLEPYVKYDDYEYEQAFSPSYVHVTGSTYQGQEKLFYKYSYGFQSSIPSGTVTESTVTVKETTTKDVTITVEKTGRKFRRKKCQ